MHLAAPNLHPKGRPASEQDKHSQAPAPKFLRQKQKTFTWGNSKYFNHCKWSFEIISQEVMALFLVRNIEFFCFGNTWASGEMQKLVQDHKAKENQDKYKTT